MSNPQEVIVYSNPAEYALWHADPMVVFPIICALVVFMATFIAAAKGRDAILRGRKRPYSVLHPYRAEPVWAYFLTSSVTALLTLWVML